MIDSLIKVLLIDDDELQYMIIEKFLDQVTSTKYQLDFVSNYEAAMEQINKKNHDVYLVDYDLGGCKGTTIIKEAIKKGCTAPMILQTSSTEHNVDVDAMESGAVDFLVKPQISPVLLERSIRYAIKQKDIETQLAEQNKLIAQHVKAAGIPCPVTSANKRPTRL